MPWTPGKRIGDFLAGDHVSGKVNNHNFCPIRET